MWDIFNLSKIFLIFLLNILWIVNLMLVNNLCDKEEDEKNYCYIFVYYIGIRGGFLLFVIFNSIVLLVIVFEFFFGFVFVIVFLSLLLILFIYK